MSHSSYFDDTLDSGFLDKVDALETEQQLDTRVSALDTAPPTPPKPFGNTNDASSARTRAPSRRNSDPFGDVFDLDNLQEIDGGLARPIPAPSNPPEIPAQMASKTLQTTHWSGVLPESHTKSRATCRTQPSIGRMPKVKT